MCIDMVTTIFPGFWQTLTIALYMAISYYMFVLKIFVISGLILNGVRPAGRFK